MLTTWLMFGGAPPHLGPFKAMFPSRQQLLSISWHFPPRLPPPNAMPTSLPPPPPPSPLSSRQTWQASLHSDFQSRPVLCQMLRGNIKRSAGQSLPGIPAWWADNWRQASADLADV